MSLEAKICTLKEQIETYKTLPDTDKLGKGNEISDSINTCETILKGYEDTLHEINNITPHEEFNNTLTQEEFIELVNEVTIASQSIKNAADLETMISTAAEMSLNINKCEVYLANRQMTTITL